MVRNKIEKKQHKITTTANTFFVGLFVVNAKVI